MNMGEVGINSRPAISEQLIMSHALATSTVGVPNVGYEACHKEATTSI
jgi:hypothetical protein